MRQNIEQLIITSTIATGFELRTPCVSTVVQQVAPPSFGYKILDASSSLRGFCIEILHTFHSDNRMSNRAERIAEDEYERKNDPSPVTGTFTDSSYAKETKSSLRDQIPVQGDSQRLEDPMQPPYSNSHQQLGMFIFFCVAGSTVIRQTTNRV